MSHLLYREIELRWGVQCAKFQLCMLVICPGHPVYFAAKRAGRLIADRLFSFSHPATPRGVRSRAKQVSSYIDLTHHLGGNPESKHTPIRLALNPLTA